MVGQPIRCLVNSVNKGNSTLSVSVDEKKFSSAFTQDANVLALDSLKAGMLVSAQVKQLLPNGLFVTFLGYFSGTIDPYHIGCSIDKIQDTYTVGQKVAHLVSSSTNMVHIFPLTLYYLCD